MANISVQLGSLTLKNPVMAASGTFGYGAEKTPFNLPVHKLGAFITKTITLNPRMGNPPPRIAETPSGIINSIGLENPGLAVFCRDYLPKVKAIKTTRIISIGGDNGPEFKEIAQTLNRHHQDIDALELNLSCPNVKKGGHCIAQNADATHQIVRQVRQITRLPLITKLSPNVGDITRIALAAESGGADAVSLINTITALSIDWRKRIPMVANGIGGLSGPAIKPIALKMVWDVSRAVKIPVIGIGGIMTADDVLEFIVAGASAVQAGTVNLVTPTQVFKIIDALKKLLATQGVSSIKSITGTLRMP